MPVFCKEPSGAQVLARVSLILVVQMCGSLSAWTGSSQVVVNRLLPSIADFGNFSEIEHHACQYRKHSEVHSQL